jgi:hypothetical protein
MNIEYNTSKYKNYGVIIYSVTIHCKDDGVHFPLYSYNGFMKLNSEDIEKSDDELYEMVLAHFKEEYKSHNHVTLEEQLDDPAFEYINISVKKEVFYDKNIKITK